MPLFGWKAEAELERIAQKVEVAFGQVCEMYVALYHEGRAPSITEVDSLGRKIEAALPWIESEPAGETEFRRIHGIE